MHSRSLVPLSAVRSALRAGGTAAVPAPGLCP